MDDDYLYVRYEGMEQASGTLATVAKTMELEVNELAKRLNAVEWDAASRAQFDVLMRKWQQAYTNMIDIVHRGSGTVRDVSGIYKGVDDWGVNAFNA